MKIKWNGKTIDLQNKLGANRKSFNCTWNDYTIVVEFDTWLYKRYKKKHFDAWCYVPSGGLIVDGSSSPTIKEAVQECFDNIGYPLMKIGDEEYDDQYEIEHKYSE